MRTTISLTFGHTTHFHREIWLGVREYAMTVKGWVIVFRPLPESIAGWPFHGLITHGLDSRQMKGLLALNLPIVDTSDALPEVNVSRAIVDEAEVARLALSHFQERSYQNFAFFADTLHPEPASRGREFVRALAKEARDCVFAPLRKPDDPFSRQFHFEVVDWLRHLPRPTALLAANDKIAEWLVDLCRRQKLRVPEDIAILGVGDDEFYCLDNYPNVSSVALPGRKIGFEAAKLLHQAMRASRPSNKRRRLVLPPTHVVVRHSTDAYALEHPILASAFRYIREHVAEPFSVADVARAIGCGRRILEVQCRKATKRTLLEHIHRMRVEQAKALLTSTDLKVEAVAEASGFTDSLQLRRAFKRYAQSSPAAYRKKHAAG